MAQVIFTKPPKSEIAVALENDAIVGPGNDAPGVNAAPEGIRGIREVGIPTR